METKHFFSRWLTLLVMGFLSIISAYAASVNIQGLTPYAVAGGIPIFKVQNSNITVSSSAGSFNYIIVDDEQIAYNSSSYWTTYSVNVSSYLDGSFHLLQLERGKSDYGCCYIGDSNSLKRISECIDGIYYLITGQNAFVIGSSSDIQQANIPPFITVDEVEYSVTSIWHSAFSGCSGLTSVIIPNSVTSIGDYAFNGCSGLTSVTIPNSVTSIGDYAFNGCSGLTSVTIPNSVTSIGSDAFNSCSGLTSVTIPNSVTSIGSYAFYYCSGLTSVTIPNSVTSIGSGAFKGCSGLTSVFIPNSVTSIGSSAFQYCDGLIKSAYPSSLSNPFSYGISVAYNPNDAIIEDGFIWGPEKSSLLFAPVSLSGEYTIPNSVTSIGNGAFGGCSGLTSVTIPNSVTSIESSVFEGCSGLTSVTIPNSVTSIGNSAFSGCSGLTSVIIPNSVTSIGSRAFYGCSGLTSVTIPNLVTSIGGDALYGCTALTALSFNATNCTICGSSSNPAFPSSISTLTIGNGVTKIPPYFLYGGSAIEQLTIPNTVTSIGDYAFYNSKNLKSLTIGSGLLSIGNRAFSYKYGSYDSNIQIAKVFWLGNTPPANSSAVTGLVNYVANDQYALSNQFKYQFLSSKFIVDGTHYVPVSPSERTCDVVDCDYSLADGNVVISDKVINRGVELTVLKINDYSFYKNSSISSLTVSNKGLIGRQAFYDCDGLLSVTANNNGGIGYWAFYYCDGLLSVTANNNGFIGQEAFAACHALKEVSITSKGDIYDKAFYGCYSLKTATVDNIGAIRAGAFKDCEALKEISITSKGDIYDNAFYGCYSLKTATVDNIGCIGANIFYQCYNLNNVSLGDSITTIGQNAFYSCASLPTITLPNNITAIGANTFSGCSKLATVNIGTGISAIPNNTFSGCSSLNNLSIPNNVKTIGDYAFSGCRSLANLTLEGNVQVEGTGNGTVVNTLQLGTNGSNPLFSECPLDVVYIGRKLSYSTASGKGYSPFYRNTSLRSVEISDAETQIYDNEFYGCSNLKTLKIGNGVKTIGKWAFSGCSSLDYFSAGYQVQSIGEEAFSDCTGLKNYYSFSIQPPVCGNQALDDINKWDCTLFVPAESSDEYMAADQWKDFFFVNENDAVLVENIRLNADSLDYKTGDTFQLTADILPDNATRKRLEWSSSDASIVTVDASGLVTFVKEGYATITVRATDGSGVEATVNVVVTVKEPELGDSNANGVVNIADAVNTANYAIGNEVEHFNETAADVNRDGVITLADASATVALILEQPVQTTSAAKVRALANAANADSDLLVIDDYSAKPGEAASVSVALDNTRDYVALQADVTVPEGMYLAAVNIGDRAESDHSLAVKRIDDRTMRMALFNVNNAVFADNHDAILELTVKVTGSTTDRIEIRNIIASDAKAHEYVLTSAGGNNTDMSGIDAASGNDIRIEAADNGINIYNAGGYDIAVYGADGTTLVHFVASSDFESRKVVPGVYVVAVGTKIEKVIVK